MTRLVRWCMADWFSSVFWCTSLTILSPLIHWTSPSHLSLRGVFLANHLASNDNLTRTTKRQNTYHYHYSFITRPLDEPQPSQPQRLSFLRGVFLANHLASNDNLTRTTRRQNTYHYHYSFITHPLDEPQPSQPMFLDCKLLTFLQPV